MTSPSPPMEVHRTSPVLAAILTIVLPGLGHAVAGYGRRGAAWAAVLLAAFVASIPAGARSLVGLQACLVVIALAAIATVIDAWRVAARGPGPRGGWAVFGVAAGLLALGAPVALAVAIRVGALESFVVRSGSMCPTFIDGDHVFADKTAFRSHEPTRGDLVIHTDPRDPGKDFVRRVVAIGGDEVVLDGHELRVGGRAVVTRALGETGCDGAALLEEDLGGGPHRIAHGEVGAGSEVRRLLVPAGTVYLLGDNRENSYDSRFVGPIPVRLVRGRVSRLWRHHGAWTWQTPR